MPLGIKRDLKGNRHFLGGYRVIPHMDILHSACIYLSRWCVHVCMYVCVCVCVCVCVYIYVYIYIYIYIHIYIHIYIFLFPFSFRSICRVCLQSRRCEKFIGISDHCGAAIR
jgi:hypothetical protein